MGRPQELAGVLRLFEAVDADCIVERRAAKGPAPTLLGVIDKGPSITKHDRAPVLEANGELIAMRMGLDRGVTERPGLEDERESTVRRDEIPSFRKYPPGDGLTRSWRGAACGTVPVYAASVRRNLCASA